MSDQPRVWSESPVIKLWVWLFIPGHLIFYWWIIAGGLVSLSALDPSIENDLSRKAGLVGAGLFAVVSGIYFLFGAYQVMLHDVRKLFIVYQLAVNNDRVEVKGYYCKHDHFTLSDIDGMKRFRVKGHWRKRIHSVFSHSTDHFRLDLKDGRQFCFQGKNKHIESVLVELTGQKITAELPINWDLNVTR